LKEGGGREKTVRDGTGKHAADEGIDIIRREK